MGNFLEGLGQSAANSTASTLPGIGMGLLLEKHNDKRQLKQQGKLQDLQIAGNKQMIDYQKGADYEMWKKTGPTGMMEQLKLAGLNPALIYGMGGGSGTTTGGTGSVSGGNAPQGGGEIQGMALQMALLDAQRRNIEADTKVKEGEAANKPLQGEEIKARTGNIKVDTELKKLDQQIKGDTLEQQIATIGAIQDKAIWEATKARNENYVSGQTLKEQIQTIRQAAIEAGVRISVGQSNIQVNNAQIQKITQEITNSIRDLDIKEAQQKLNDWAEKAKIDVANKGLNIMLIRSTLDSILRLGMN